jgi:hypothetical protein
VNLIGHASVHIRTGQYSKAEPRLQRAISILEQADGPERLDLNTALEKYALVLRKTKREKDADRLEQRLSALVGNVN